MSGAADRHKAGAGPEALFSPLVLQLVSTGSILCAQVQTDTRVEEALRACLKRSLQELTRVLGGAARKDPQPLLAASLLMADEGFKMELQPTVAVRRTCRCRCAACACGRLHRSSMPG